MVSSKLLALSSYVHALSQKLGQQLTCVSTVYMKQ